jgi:hypothetical protein
MPRGPKRANAVPSRGARDYLDLFLERYQRAGRDGKPDEDNQSSFDLAVSLANRSAFSRSRFLRSAVCSCSYSVRGLSDGRIVLPAAFSSLLPFMT